jgi:hypothetical protein
MGEARKRPLRLHFDRRLKLEFHGARVSSDAGRLRVDPVARHVIGRKAKDHPAASTSQMGRFETEILATEENLAALTDLNEEWVVRACTRTPMDRLVLDMDSSVSPTYGEKVGSAYNGHFGLRGRSAARAVRLPAWARRSGGRPSGPEVAELGAYGGRGRRPEGHLR